ncbi:hypothetical protein KAW18_17950 [candidate division WOR-3 bacterium]|nr:hypothetical protein [candidate division WOR-3 bacterium]
MYMIEELKYVLCFILVFLIMTAGSAAATITVDDEGGSDYISIQAVAEMQATVIRLLFTQGRIPKMWF